MKGTANMFSFGNFVWWLGVIEDRKTDPLKLGRVKVRIFGYHSKDTGDISTDQLMWAQLIHPITSAAVSGIGTSPTGMLEGTHVVGFFMDGESAQVPIIMGSIGAIPPPKKPGEGFNDPNGVYPRYPEGESDVNRLTKVEKINETIVQKKKDGIDTANQAFGGTWREKETMYAAEYPYNHVRESETGHIEEFDDTPGAERYGLWHRRGTFKEIHPDGDEVNKVVKDRYTVIMNDEYCHVIGNAKVTTTGNSWVLIEGDAFVEVKGDMQEYVHGDYSLRVGGNYTVQVDGAHIDNSNTSRSISAPRIDWNPDS